MRLIDADAVLHDFEILWDYSTVDGIPASTVLKQVKTDVQNVPTVDAVPVKHGEWIWDDEGYHCSICWYHAYGCTSEVFSSDWKFCPRCGAKMDGKKGVEKW